MINNNQTKTVLITGTSSGLGLELCKRLLDQGWKVVGIDLNDSCINHHHYSHIKSPLEEMNISTLENIGLFDFVIWNAAFGYYGNFKEQDRVNILKNIQINLIRPLQLSLALLRYMNENSQMIFIGSVSGFLPAKQHEVYGACKAAIFGFVRSVRHEKIINKIKMRVYLPGPMKTNFHQAVGFSDIKESFQKPEEVAADLVRFIKSPAWWSCSRWFFYPVKRLLIFFPLLPFIFVKKGKQL